MTRHDWLRRVRLIALDDAEFQEYLDGLKREVALRVHADAPDATPDQVGRVAQALIEAHMLGLVYGDAA